MAGLYGYQPDLPPDMQWDYTSGKPVAVKKAAGTNMPNYLTQAKPGIDPMTGKAIPTASTLGAGNGPMVYAGQAPTPSIGSPSPLAGMGGGSSGMMSMGGTANSALSPYIASVQQNPQMNAILQKLIASLTSNQNEQKTAALAQHKSLMDSVAGTRKNVEGLFGQLGQSGLADIAEQERQQSGAARSNAVSRGLGNTTITDNLQQGVSRNAQRARTDLNTSIAGQKAGFEMGLGQMQGDALLSLNHQPTDIGMYLNLIQSLAGGR